ncbi:MAG: hypothetical protein DI598_07135 [Pseudopedobacter saltans]|uniref:Uncharacterized protein n=1 Tax=Pseudopedobacter saltans TaxID=151895 RepID=A0A2W5H7E0_9SPHI|nr:MAG: hypothetical protein DI598_07135 [Pseudopedobacter saltans]
MNQKIFGLFHFLKSFILFILLELGFNFSIFISEKEYSVLTAIYSKIFFWTILFLLLNPSWTKKYFFYYNLGLTKAMLWGFTFASSSLLTAITLFILFKLS